MKNILNLNIQHNIHLTREQRYQLHDGVDVEVVGVSIPVWIINNVTSEPVTEVFCKYYLKNPKLEIPIKILKDGYEITIPYRQGKKLEISDEEWRDLSFKNPDKLHEMYASLPKEVSTKNLLDLIEGGSEFMNYKELNKIMINDKTINVMHFVTISTIEKLNISLE